MKNNEQAIVDEEIILSIISIGTIIISISLLYNQRCKLNGTNKIYNNKEEYNVNLYNKIFIFIVFAIFLFININIYNKIKKEGKEDPRPYLLQIYSSILIIIATIITLYVAYITPIKDESDIENPTI